MFITETKIRVRYADTDQMGVVYHGNYFQYYEAARTESIRGLGFTYADMEKMGIIMPVVEVHSKFLRPAVYDDLLTVKVILKELPLHHKVEFFHEIYNEREQLLTTGKVVLYFLEAKTMIKSTMPTALKEKLESYFG
ncbi:MAG TPA: thioesterase family protein [Chitinophagaceae bacterium]